MAARLEKIVAGEHEGSFRTRVDRAMPARCRRLSAHGEEMMNAGGDIAERSSRRAMPRWVVAIALGGTLMITGNRAGCAEPAPPVPRSSVIADIDWAPASEIVRDARDGDNWPVTWGPGDALTTTWGDGTGFEPKVKEKLSLGLARITGPADDFKGTNIRSPIEQY